MYDKVIFRQCQPIGTELTKFCTHAIMRPYLTFRGAFMDEQDELLSAAEVAKILRMSERKVSRLLNSGDLVGSKIGKEWRVWKSEVYDFIRRKSTRKT